MDEQKKELLAFLREHRSNEANFNLLYERLNKALGSAPDQSIKAKLEELKEKEASVYLKAKEETGEAWPEFEKFVTGFERALLE